MLSAFYGRRPPRRPASGLERHRAKRRIRPFRLADLGAWAARKSKNAAAVAPRARTELCRLALLGPGGPRSDLLRLIASRRTVQLLHKLLSEQPERLLLIEGPPLCRPEGQALALFAGQVNWSWWQEERRTTRSRPRSRASASGPT